MKRSNTSLGAVILSIALCAFTTAASAQTWQRLLNPPPFRPGTPLLLTDGSVMVQAEATPNWWKLTPDVHGDYVHGTWKQLASLPSGYAPTYFASAVLADGRVFVMGGEFNFGLFSMTNQGALYDPILNVWTPLASPVGWFNIGDAQCVVLPDGHLMLAHPLIFASTMLDPTTLAWGAPPFADPGKADRNDEEGWTLLPDGTVLTVDAIAAPHTERFIPSLGTWISAGNTPAILTDLAAQEMGPAILRPDGTVFATGATGHTAIYKPGAALTDPGTWTAGPDFPICTGTNCFGQQLGIADGPACLLPSGNVLAGASPKFTFPTQFFEFDGTGFNPVPAPLFAINNPSFAARMLLLPSGQVFYTDANHFEAEIYTPAGGPQDAWRPAISRAPASVDPGQTFFVTGTQFNGLSQASVYGDDATSATNYPIARITNTATGHIFYARTSSHSTMGVATGQAPVFTNVTVPPSVELGPSMLEIVANGIASLPVPISIGGGNATPDVRGLSTGLSFNGFTPDPSIILNLDGVNFQAGDSVTWTAAGSQTPLTTTFVSANQLSADLPASLVADAGMVFVQVARADGTLSNATTFVLPIAKTLVSSVGNGNVADAGSPGFTLAVNGARFGSADIVNWTVGGVTSRLATTFVSAGQLKASVPAGLILQPTVASITVSHPGGRVSNALSFFVFAPPPSLNSVSPNPVSAGTPSFTLVLNGAWFDHTSTAMWQPAAGAAIPLATTFVSQTRLTAVVPASFVATAGTAGVWVNSQESDPTDPIPFVITPPLELHSVSAPVSIAETPFAIILNGENFIDGAQVSIDGRLLPAVFLSAGQMTADVPASVAGKYSVNVVNPGGAISGEARPLTVSNPVPAISALGVSVSPEFTVTIDGTNFVSTSVARWSGTAVPTKSISPTRLQATIPAALLTKSGKFTITIVNPAPGGGNSNGVDLTVN